MVQSLTRITDEQIAELERIKWWDWSDEEIAARFDDFCDIDEFIRKHGEQEAKI